MGFFCFFLYISFYLSDLNIEISAQATMLEWDHLKAGKSKIVFETLSDLKKKKKIYITYRYTSLNQINLFLMSWFCFDEIKTEFLCSELKFPFVGFIKKKKKYWNDSYQVTYSHGLVLSKVKKKFFFFTLALKWKFIFLQNALVKTFQIDFLILK